MKLMFLISSSFLCILTAAQQSISLQDLVQAALRNKNKLQAVKTNELITALETEKARNGYLPQISLQTEQRYNAILNRQVIPVGEFKPIPDNEQRAIQFGTRWQFSAGMDIKQPIYDATIKKRIRERQLNEQLAKTDSRIEEEFLLKELLQCLLQLELFQKNKNAAATDSLRTFNTVTLCYERYREGRILKSDYNTAFIRHQTAVLRFNDWHYAMLSEIAYLRFLTGLPEEAVLNFSIPVQELNDYIAKQGKVLLQPEKDDRFQRYEINNNLLKAQLETEKANYKPQLSLTGYLGANQFTNTFNPFEPGSYFGNSYIGFNVKLPLMDGEKRTLKKRITAIQLRQNEFNKRELKDDLVQKLIRLNNDLEKAAKELTVIESNRRLLLENRTLTESRFAEGKISAIELNDTELEYEQLQREFEIKSWSFLQKKLDLMYVSGNIRLLIPAGN